MKNYRTDSLSSFHLVEDFPSTVDLSELTFSNVQVEEVAVQDSLDNASHNGNHVKEALEVEAPDPVEEIQGSVQAQEE